MSGALSVMVVRENLFEKQWRQLQQWKLQVQKLNVVCLEVIGLQHNEGVTALDLRWQKEGPNHVGLSRSWKDVRFYFRMGIHWKNFNTVISDPTLSPTLWRTHCQGVKANAGRPCWKLLLFQKKCWRLGLGGICRGGKKLSESSYIWRWTVQQYPPLHFKTLSICFVTFLSL